MEATTMHSTSALLQAVESLKNAGLSGIGDVMQTASPEYLDAASITQHSHIVEHDVPLVNRTTNANGKLTSIQQQPKKDITEHDEMRSVDIQIHPESISQLGSIDGTLGLSVDMATVSIATADIETVQTAITKDSAPSPPLSLTALMAPNPDTKFSLEDSTQRCSKGKELWAQGKCEESLYEFRRALLGLESLLGNNHLLVSRLYHWMGQVFLQLLEEEENNAQNDKRRRALADAAVESLAWSLKIRYTQQENNDQNEMASNQSEEESISDIEDALQQAWKVQAKGLPLSTSSRTQRSKSINLLKDSINIERKADLALFRMEKNQLSQAIDVYVSLVNQYNKAISMCGDDGGFSSMTKMAFWYHKLGRIRAAMDQKDDSDADDDSVDSYQSFNSAPLDQTEHSKANQGKEKKKSPKSVSLSYLEQAALWYRMALEVFCTSIGRFDKVNEERKREEAIDVTTHPTYQQLLLRIEQVLSDHSKGAKKNDKGETYLQSLGVLESVLHHFGAKEAMKHHQKFNIKLVDSLPQLKALKENLTKAEKGFSASLAIEESTWGRDHQIVVRMRHELGRASRLRDTLDLEISAFPAKQAMKRKQKEEEELEKKKQREREEKFRIEQQKRKLKSSSGSLAGFSRDSSKYPRMDRSRGSRQSKVDELLGSTDAFSFQSKGLPQQSKGLSQQRQRQQKQQKQPHERQQQALPKKQKLRAPSGSKAPSGSIAGSMGRTPNNAIETLRRLQNEVYESQKLLEGRTAERDEMRDQLESQKGEMLQAMATVSRKDEEVNQWKQSCEEFQNKQEALQVRIKELENQVSQSKRKQGQLEFTMKKEGADLVQSATQKEVELEYWRQKFEAAQAEWTECQNSLEEELRKARNNAGSREADLIEWRGKFEGVDGERKSCQDQVRRLQEENLRLQNEVASGLAERKQLQFAKQMIELEVAQNKDQEVLEAMAKATKSESEAASWKRKYDAAQKEWLAIHSRADEKTREAIADVTLQNAELSRWKKKFEIAQREWMECQTRVEGQARGAIATAKQYEVSHAELAKKFTAAQTGLKNLVNENKQLRKQVADSEAKQDQLQFTLKKQAIDFSNIHETLNRKTAEAQIWKEQCQSSQQAQKQISQEIQFSRAADGSLHDRIVDLRQQNEDLKERNRELLADQESKKLELEAKNKEVALVKEAALKRIRQLKNEQKLLKGKDTKAESDFVNYHDPNDTNSLAAKLGRAQRALEYVQKDHKESMEEIESLKIAKMEMEGNVAEAQKIISMLRTANTERIEQCSKLENEKNETLRKLEELKSLGSRTGESHSRRGAQQLEERISTLESELKNSEVRNEELLSDLKKQKLRSYSPSRKWSSQTDTEKQEETKVLKDRCEELERELAGFKKSRTKEYSFKNYKDDKEKIRSLLKHCDGLERDIIIATHQIEDLEDELREYREQGGVGDWKKEYHDMILAQDLERELEESNIIRKNLSSELEAYKGNVSRHEEKEKEFKKQLDVSSEQIKSLRNSVRDLTKVNLSQHNDGKKDKRNLAIIEDLEEELEDSNEIRENLAAELKLCKERLLNAERKEKEFQWLSKEYSRLEEKLEESNQIREEMATKLSSMKEQLMRAEKKESESGILETKLIKLEQQLEETSEHNERLKSHIDNLSFASGTEDEQRQRLVDKIYKLERELGGRAEEIRSLKKERDKVSEDLEDLEEENEELTAKYEKLQKQYRGTKRQAEQSTRSLSTMLQAENQEQERVRLKYAKLETDLAEMTLRNKELESSVGEMKQKNTGNLELEEDLREMSKRNKELESRIDEMRKRNIENLKLEKDFEKISERNKELESRIDRMRKRNIDRIDDDSNTSCQQCHVLGEELRSTIEQNEKHMLTTEKFQDDHDQLLDRYNFLEKELKEAIEQNEILESQIAAKDNDARDERLDNDDKYQELNIRCIELEEQLRDSSDLNDKKTAQLAALKTKCADLEAYADETASDLEQAESIIAALKAEGVGGGAEMTLLMGRCNQLQNQLKEAQRAAEKMSHDLDNSQKENIQMKEELSESMDNVVVNINVEEGKAENTQNTSDKAFQELKEKFDEVTAAKEELESLLKKATEDSEQQKRLKGHVEKDRDYLDKMYNECKNEMAKVQSDLDATKELLKKSNDEKEELERQLQIEQHVSQSLKASQNNQDADNSEENELEELYRQARDELTEVENMLFETEEELEALKAKYAKLEEESKLPSSDRVEEEEINHDIHDLSRDELIKETQKALRKMQETQLKVADLQETNMILQAQLKSSLTFKEKSKAPPRRRNNNNNNNNNNNGGRGGFWSLGGGDAAAKSNDGNANNGEKVEGRFFGWRGRGRGANASNEKSGEDVTGNEKSGEDDASN